MNGIDIHVLIALILAGIAIFCVGGIVYILMGVDDDNDT